MFEIKRGGCWNVACYPKYICCEAVVRSIVKPRARSLSMTLLLPMKWPVNTQVVYNCWLLYEIIDSCVKLNDWKVCKIDVPAPKAKKKLWWGRLFRWRAVDSASRSLRLWIRRSLKYSLMSAASLVSDVIACCWVVTWSDDVTPPLTTFSTCVTLRYWLIEWLIDRTRLIVM